MPGYHGHIIGGLAASNMLLALLTCTGMVHPTPLGTVEWIVAGLLGSLFPDIDIKSKGQKLFYWILLFLYLYLFVRKHLIVLGIFSIVGIAPMLVKHRGIFHRWWFIILFPASLALIAIHHFPCYTGMIVCNALFFIVGAFSHLFLDFKFKSSPRRR